MLRPLSVFCLVLLVGRRSIVVGCIPGGCDGCRGSHGDGQRLAPPRATVTVVG
ncbi:hypothetical protein DVA67_032465 [Solirubrobacter sp. CPCC 204708]|nr:hypothetical protein [Solirubrobacter deserti]